jgi:hypothetical protein
MMIKTPLTPKESTMTVKFTPKQRADISADAKGKVIESLEWEESDPSNPADLESGYWVMTFTDGSEMSFRFMAELFRG